MTTVRCYVSKLPSEDASPVWEAAENPPCVSIHNHEVVLRLPDLTLRGYVNGYPVIGGIQTLRGGDLVRIWKQDGTETFFRLAGVTEAGEGRCCAFTGEPFEGPAVRCGPCGRLLSQEVVEQTGRCVCGRPLTVHGEQLPLEELL